MLKTIYKCQHVLCFYEFKLFLLQILDLGFWKMAKYFAKCQFAEDTGEWT